MLKFILLVITLLFSNYSSAAYYYIIETMSPSDTRFTTPEAACAAENGNYQAPTNCYTDFGLRHIGISQPICEQKYDSGMFWGATSAPATFCDGQCEWKVEKSACGADYNQDGTFTGASSCAYDAQTNGNSCTQQTGTPQNPTPTPPPPMSPCGPGKTMGVINGTTICVNNSAPPPNCTKLANGNYNCVPKDPNDPNTPPNPNNPPTGGGSGGCTSNCNNTTNNNTTNNNTTNNVTNNITNNTTEAPAVDLSPVIDKLNQVDTGIKAVDTAIKAVGTGIKAVETAINTTSQTITNAVNAVKDKVTEVKNSVDQAKEQAKTDAATQKAATDAAKEQAKTDAKTQKDATDGVKKAIEDQTAQDKAQNDKTKEHRDWEKLQHICTISSNGTYLVDGKVTVNSKICDNVDSFEGYKKWIQGEGKDAQGNDLGIPSTLPDGRISTASGSLSEYGMTGTEMEGNYINFGGSCPADVSIPINVGQGHGNITMSWKPMCDLAPMLRAVFIAMAYFSGAFIVLGVGKPTNSGA